MKPASLRILLAYFAAAFLCVVLAVVVAVGDGPTHTRSAGGRRFVLAAVVVWVCLFAFAAWLQKYSATRKMQ